MSKIFEALQRAQQQGGNPAEPGTPAATAEPVPAAESTPPPESSLLWDAPPAAQEDLLFGTPPASGYGAPPAPGYGPPPPPAFAPPPAGSYGPPPPASSYGPPPASGYGAPPAPGYGPPPAPGYPPPPAYGAPPASGYGPPPAPAYGPPPAFGGVSGPPPPSAYGPPPPNFASDYAPPSFNPDAPQLQPSSPYALPGQIVPSLPLSNVDHGAPAVWEPPSLVRFSPRSKVVVAQNPTSLAAEQYRVLRTNIVKLSQTQALKVILVTSPGPGDGKTLTTMNLALSFCQKPETRVLLIEADLRKPSVGALVAMNPGPGLSDYLAGEATLEQVVRPTSIPNFHLLDSGKRAAMPADLLHSPRLANMMEVLRSHFNWIVLDGPPTNPVADYELLTPICDGVILVVRPFYTQRDLLRLTTEALRGRKVLGCVINGSKHFERYGSAYGYGYGYGPGNDAAATAQTTQKQKMRKKRVTKSTEEI